MTSSGLWGCCSDTQWLQRHEAPGSTSSTPGRSRLQEHVSWAVPLARVYLPGNIHHHKQTNDRKHKLNGSTRVITNDSLPTNCEFRGRRFQLNDSGMRDLRAVVLFPGRLRTKELHAAVQAGNMTHYFSHNSGIKLTSVLCVFVKSELLAIVYRIICIF